MAFFRAGFFKPNFFRAEYFVGVTGGGSGGGATGIPIGWGTGHGHKHRVAGQRGDDIKIERRQSKGHSKLRIQEIDNHDIMLFVKTFRQFGQ